ncbi:MAG: hypothetical protein ACYS5W_12735 [Planctomycetota bacterium]|jgi:hypothetical protein
MMRDFPKEARFLLDEMESFEDNRRTRPVTIPVLVERTSYFVVGTDCAPIRPRGRMTPDRRQAIARAGRAALRQAPGSLHSLPPEGAWALGAPCPAP